MAKMVAAPRPALRRTVIVAAICVLAFLVFLSFIERDFLRLFCAIFAGVLVWNCLTRFKLEHSIVQSHRESVGRVSKYRRLGTKRGSIIDYSFLSADNEIHFATHHGDNGLPQEGQTFLVAYNSADPSLSLPLFSFWFYKFAFEFPKNATPASA